MTPADVVKLSVSALIVVHIVDTVLRFMAWVTSLRPAVRAATPVPVQFSLPGHFHHHKTKSLHKLPLVLTGDRLAHKTSALLDIRGFPDDVADDTPDVPFVSATSELLNSRTVAFASEYDHTTDQKRVSECSECKAEILNSGPLCIDCYGKGQRTPYQHAAFDPNHDQAKGTDPIRNQDQDQSIENTGPNQETTKPEHTE